MIDDDAQDAKSNELNAGEKTVMMMVIIMMMHDDAGDDDV